MCVCIPQILDQIQNPSTCHVFGVFFHMKLDIFLRLEEPRSDHCVMGAGGRRQEELVGNRAACLSGTQMLPACSTGSQSTQ